MKVLSCYKNLSTSVTVSHSYNNGINVMGIANHFSIDSVSLENLNNKKRKDSFTEALILFMPRWTWAG